MRVFLRQRYSSQLVVMSCSSIAAVRIFLSYKHPLLQVAKSNLPPYDHHLHFPNYCHDTQ